MTRNDQSIPRLINRRSFLGLAAGGFTVVAIGACSDDDSSAADPTSTTGGTTSENEALPRPTVRLPFGAFGFPSPFSSNGPPGYVQMSLLYDTLVWKDSTGEPLPWLAESVERSPDDLRYTFMLRDGISWSDGVVMTADDVVFTFDYYSGLDALPPPVIGQPPSGIASVDATDANVIVVTLDRPDVTFLDQVAGIIPIIPRHIWEDVVDPAAEQGVDILVGSGPYRLDSGYDGDGGALLYVARDDYFLGTPFVERIEFTDVGDQFAALEANAVDSATDQGLRDDILDRFDNEEFETLTVTGASASVLYFNMGEGGALADVAFRQACAMTIDRQDLVDRLAGGNGSPGNPGFLGGENPAQVDVEQYDLDVEGANALLDRAGYTRSNADTRQDPDGAPLAFELLVSNAETALGELVSTALAAIGVETTIVPAEPGPQLFGPKFVGSFQLAILGFPGPSAGSLNGDPDLLRQVFASTAPPSLTSAAGYSNADFDQLADRQRTLFDESERMTVVAEMQEMIAADLPVLALYSPDTSFVFRPDVLEEWYLTPGRSPVEIDNKQLFVTGRAAGTEIRPAT